MRIITKLVILLCMLFPVLAQAFPIATIGPRRITGKKRISHEILGDYDRDHSSDI